MPFWSSGTGCPLPCVHHDRETRQQSLEQRFANLEILRMYHKQIVFGKHAAKLGVEDYRPECDAIADAQSADQFFQLWPYRTIADDRVLHVRHLGNGTNDVGGILLGKQTPNIEQPCRAIYPVVDFLLEVRTIENVVEPQPVRFPCGAR